MNISIVIPVYNSAKILPVLINKIIKNLKKSKIKKFEVFLVNDSSLDNSWEVIKKLTNKKKYLKGINLDKNYGQHNAIAAGLYYCKNDLTILMDDDMQHDPIYITQIINELKKGFDACYVRYLKRKHNLWKKVVSKLNHITSSFLAEKTVDIYASSFKGFNKKVRQKINGVKDKEIFLDWIIINNSSKIQSINIIHRERLKGITNYNLKKLFILWGIMILKIKNKNKIKKLIVFFIKFFLVNPLMKLIKKEKNKEKFLIREKTF